MTASVMYNRPLARGSWASTLLWGRNRVLETGEVFNGYLAESTLQFSRSNHVWGRIEGNVIAPMNCCWGSKLEPPELLTKSFLRAYSQFTTVGYDHDFPLIPVDFVFFHGPGRTGRTFMASPISSHSLFTESIRWELTYCLYACAPITTRRTR